jgi:thiopurine S-methyltransferase
MQYEFWKSRWDEEKIGFHLGRPHPALERHIGLFAGATSVLVPLAGKTVDIDRLADVVPEVIANEFVESAARAYFAERELVPRERAQGTTLILQHGQVSYLVDDFFALVPPPVQGRVSAIFDRAALVAIDPSERPRYVEALASMLRPGGTILLICFEYDQSKIQGPPFSIPEGEVHALFDARFQVALLEHMDEPSGDRFRDAGIPVLRESIYQLTMR